MIFSYWVYWTYSIPILSLEREIWVRGIFHVRGHLHISFWSQVVMWKLPASGLETIFSHWVYWTYLIPIRLLKKRSGSEVFFMFGIICIIFHLDHNLLCKNLPAPSLETIVSYREYWTYWNPIRLWKKRCFSCSGSALQVFRDAHHLWWLLCTPLNLHSRFPWLQHV